MMFRAMRRFKQELPLSEAEEILSKGAYCVLSVLGDDGCPYAVPVNYVYDGASVYFHSASCGHKVDSLRCYPKCSLCVVDRDDVIPEEFTSYFRSVIVFGNARFLETTDEKIEALRLLCAKYSPGIDPTTEIRRFINSVCIIRISVDRISGKEAIELTRARPTLP